MKIFSVPEPDRPSDPAAAVPAPGLLEMAVARDFGANAWLAMDLLAQFRRDSSSVDPNWQAYFQGLGADQSPAPPGPEPPRPAAPPAVVVPAPPPPPPPPEGGLAPLAGPALRLAQNMEDSLGLPTASSVRMVPARILEENRRLLNEHRDAAGEGRISFTHLVAWALVKALADHPRLNDAYGAADGRPQRVRRESVRLGIAVDLQRKDGSRMLLVPNIKDAGRLGFSEFLAAFDAAVAGARQGTAAPDDYAGTTVTLTNAGITGTTFSSPRLMPGQGLIVATGALDYPAEFRSMAPRARAALGISKVMAVTSTYDHRITQGAESGQFLARLDALLQGEDGFYEEAFAALGIAAPPLRWEPDSAPPLPGPGAGREELVEKQARLLQLIRAYRVRGHLVADLDPLDAPRPAPRELEPAAYGLSVWDLDREFFTNGLAGRDQGTLREILDVLRDTYCRTVGAEYMFIQEPAPRDWLQERMETSRNQAALDGAERRRILERLVAAEAFERFLHTKYIGHKRFSLEGCEALIPLLDRLLSDAARAGLEEAVVGMSHRGRLNVLANTVGKPLARIFAEFEGNVDPDTIQGSGDVKYHLGAAGIHQAPGGETIAVTLSPNPSHLEAVNPVVEGMVRARQDLAGDTAHARFLPILLHGDAAFAGEGIVAETLNLAELEGYTTGGTIHVVVNNQIGFTTLPEDARSSTYCTDVARMVQAPILHVNADDPEAVAHVAALAFRFLTRFRHDVVIDLVGYRRWGHNEGDEPSYTQPLMYAKIRTHPTVAKLYGEALVRRGAVTEEELAALWAAAKAQMQEEGQPGSPAPEPPPPAPDPPPAQALEPALHTALAALGSVPEGFSPHPKLLPFLQRRQDLAEGRGEVDWATAEALAFGTLVQAGISVRLSGQDVARGTFSQRHAILYDVRTRAEHVPLDCVAARPARFQAYDSLLSEAAVLGFEYGYSVASPGTLTLWEAQFGDFANCAQVIIDNFMASSESKWGQTSGVVLLLPHGYEGQGPEHSSARLERFLQLCAEDNLRVCVPSTPASCFHLLRRQALDPVRKPLVVFTPKSLLRHPRCVSPLETLAAGGFSPVLADPFPRPKAVRRVVLACGKLVYDLLEHQEKSGSAALVRLEQLHPFPGAELGRILAAFPADAELVWAQEEPRNQGAWQYVRGCFLDGLALGAEGRVPSYAGRPAAAATATGSHHAHVQEQEDVVRAALGLPGGEN
jgi:2-oxoglutarate dehydrogenase E1 component